MKTLGFTLIELLIVIAILIILATVSVVTFSNLTNNARTSAALSSMVTVEDAMSRYKVRNEQLPPTGGLSTYTTTDNTIRANLWKTQVLDNLTSPAYGGPYIEGTAPFIYDPWGQAYFYEDHDINSDSGNPNKCFGGGTSQSHICSAGPNQTWDNYGPDDICVTLQCN